MPKIKVLLLLYDLSLTGAPKSILDTFDALRDDVEVRVLAISGGPLEAKSRELDLTRCLTTGSGAGNSYIQRLTNRASKGMSSFFIRRWKPDIIYVNSVAALFIARWFKLPNAPVVLHVHELDTITEIFTASCKDLLQEWPDRYIAVSQPVRDMLVERYGIDKNHVSVVNPCVRDDDFRTMFSEPDKSDARFVVGGAGKPSWRKGTTLWLQTAKELIKILGEDKIRFVWVGLSTDQDSLFFREEVRKLNLESVVDLVNSTPEPFKHYAGFDIFALTSWEDPCPAVVFENMMLKNPVVCFAGSGGAPEEVGDTGIIIEEFSPIDMAKAIVILFAQPERRAALGEAARSRVEEHFKASGQVPKILAEIQRLVVPEKARIAKRIHASS